MHNANTGQPQSLSSRGCVVAIAALSAVVALLVVGVRYNRKQTRLSFEHQQEERRQEAFDRVKSGDYRVSITDSNLLPMLAGDADCIANLTELSFSMTEITPDSAKYVSQLKNVHTLSFYDTRGTELVLERARGLPIKVISLDNDRLSKDALRGLDDFPELTYVRFGCVMFPNEIAIVKSLPKRISVHIPFPAEKEPWFKERGEPADAPES